MPSGPLPNCRAVGVGAWQRSCSGGGRAEANGAALLRSRRSEYIGRSAAERFINAVLALLGSRERTARFSQFTYNLNVEIKADFPTHAASADGQRTVATTHLAARQEQDDATCASIALRVCADTWQDKQPSVHLAYKELTLLPTVI